MKSSSASDMDRSDTDRPETLPEVETLSEMTSEMDPLEAELGIPPASEPWTTPITLVCRLVGEASRNLDWMTPWSL